MQNLSLTSAGRVLAVLVAGSALLSGCLVSIEGENTNPPVPGAAPTQGNNPIIQALSANPTNLTKGQPVTVTIKAADPKGQPLDYTWSATGGTLSTTTGQLVQWHPPTTAGTYTISVLVSNGTGGSTSGSLNLMVDTAGHGTIAPAAAAPAPGQGVAVGEPAPGTAPTNVETPATPDDGEMPATPEDGVSGKVLLADSFEMELANWVNDNTYSNIFTVRRSGAQDGQTALVWGHDDKGTIKASSGYGGFYSYYHLTSKGTVDLTGTKKPMIRFYVNNNTIPSGVLQWKVKVGTAEHTFNPNGQPGWTLKEFDLSKAIGENAKVQIGISTDNTTSLTFEGPMLDNVTVYDAGQ